MTIFKAVESIGSWAQGDPLRVHRPTDPPTYDQMLRAPARIEEWLTARGEYSREAVREMVEMVVGSGT